MCALIQVISLTYYSLQNLLFLFQVSVLSANEGRLSCHWFTGTPNPQISVFKPFIFTNNVRISPHIQSPVFSADEDPAKVTILRNSFHCRNYIYNFPEHHLCLQGF